MESKNGETIIEGSIGLGVTHRPKGNSCIADDEDMKALKIEAKRVRLTRLDRYLKRYSTDEPAQY